MLDSIFILGVGGAGVLVVGAAYPDKKVSHPVKSLKNWLFAVGGLVMLIYSIFNYVNGGSVFFVFLEALVNIASLFMMLDTDDKIDTPILVAAGLGFIVWSLFLFEGYNTIFFIAGLVGISMGYAFKMGTLRRNLALTLGSALVAVFSYIEVNWVFFWLNVFFALFSGYYAVKFFFSKE